MAMQNTYVCSACSHEIESWDEGNPYYRDARGRKKYAYHPDRERALCTENDVPHLCMSCCKEVLVDTAAPRETCDACGSKSLVDTWELDGKECPWCRAGTLVLDPKRTAIS